MAPRPAGAQPSPRRHVDVVEVSGLVDRVLVEFIVRAVAEAERSGAVALVLQVDSGGATAGEADRLRVVTALAEARVPVGVWVGPSGARAAAGALDLVDNADVAGVAPGARLAGGSRPGLLASPTLGDFIVDLDGRRIDGRRLSTARVIRADTDMPRREPTVTVRFAKVAGTARVLHTAASPPVAYLLLLTGLLLIVFELFTAGVGIAAAIGAVCVLLAGYGLGELPVRPWALALVVLGVLVQGIDVQAGAPRAWTVIGMTALVIGSVRLYESGGPAGDIRLRLTALGVGVGGVALVVLAGMPSMVRARFGTPTIGRESMIGDEGVATSEVAPDGTVTLRGAPWRARTNRATPIVAGAPVRVVGIDGLVLEVEPVEGGARDYRH